MKKNFFLFKALVVLAGFPELAVCAEGIEEIVITAQKREESLRDVPLSVVALSGDELDRKGIYGLEQIALKTPNVTYEKWGDLKLMPPTIRGVFGGATGGNEASIGTYIDEVYLGTGVASAVQMFDLERIEVLRGPQGTLFGRNTTGGALSLIARKPQLDKSEGYLHTTFGNYQTKRISAAVGAPLIDGVLAGRIAGVYHNRDGWTRNVYLNKDVNDENYAGVRGSLLYSPSDASEWLFTVDYRKVDQHPLNSETIQPNFLFEESIPGFPGGPAFTFNDDGDPKNFSMSADAQSHEELDGWGAMLKGTLEFEHFDLTSITGYREHDYYNVKDTDRSPVRWLTDGDPEDHEQWSQELRWTSKQEGKLDWIVGLYYYHQETANNSFVTVEQDIAAYYGFAIDEALLSEANGLVETDSYATYGQLNYHFTERLDLILGLRISRDEKSVVYSQYDNSDVLIPGGFFGVIPEYSDDAAWTEPTYDATLRYKWPNDWMGYVKFSRGYKAGGFNDAYGNADNPSFDPEFVESYEAGLKGETADGTIRLNMSVYYMEWEDIQISGYTTIDTNGQAAFGVVTGNFGKATSRGFELESSFHLSEALSIYLNAGIMDAEITQGDTPEPGSDPFIASGNKLPGPESSFLIGLQYNSAIDVGAVDFDINYSWSGERFLSTTGSDGNDPRTYQGAYGLLNARTTLTPNDSRWSISVWGNNLTDERYYTRVALFDFSPVNLVLANLGAPRTYGIDLRFNF